MLFSLSFRELLASEVKVKNPEHLQAKVLLRLGELPLHFLRHLQNLLQLVRLNLFNLLSLFVQLVESEEHLYA